MSSTLCDHCTGLCCRYFALPIDRPETPGDFDDVRWYLMHEGTSVFVENGQWYLNVEAKCKNLMRDNRCAVYEKRPRTCRNYKTDNCDYHDGSYEYEHHFTDVESLEAYARRFLRARYRKNGQKDAKRSERTKARSAA